MARGEVRQQGQGRLDRDRQSARTERDDVAIRGVDRPSEPAKKDNSMQLLDKDYGPMSFTRPGLIVRGSSDSRVVGQWKFRSPSAIVEGMRFFASGSAPCAILRDGARVTFRNCTFTMGSDVLSEGVNIEAGCKADFDGCIFQPELNAGAGQPISHAGQDPLNVSVRGSMNLTGRLHGNVTVYGEFL